MQDPNSIAPPALRGNLLGLLTAAFYILFTLLPDSNSLMLSWPWVFLWQVGLICPVLWLLGMLWQRQLRWLGHRLDWLAGILIVGLVVSAGFATFPRQAQWHSWTVFCMLATLYAVSSWLSTRDRRVWLLTMQGYLNLAFIAISLLLWTSQTLLPELSRLQEFQRFGISLPFDFSNIELRNWAPIGHQNYVAGYLTLALPVLVALAICHPGRQRWLWGTGIGGGLLALYTTSSRSGWLAIAVLAVITLALMLWQSTLPKRWLGMISAVGLVSLGLMIFSNNRLRSLLSGQSGGESAFRLITITTGWQMGWSDPLTGIGLGGVPLLYQKFRPAWAGREAELVYQLHSTPAQLWAELGIWSVLVGIGAIAVLSYLGIRWWQWRQREYWVRVRSLVEEIGSEEDEEGGEDGEDGEVASLSQLLTRDLSPDHWLIGAIYAGFLAYGIVSLTDYQLDNLAISGTLIIYLAILTAEFRSPPSSLSPLSSLSPSLPHLPRPAFLPLTGLGILLAAIVWLIPIHHAWMLSSQAFVALSRENLLLFVDRLTQAHKLAPWEPYYPWQLGWNLGDRSLQTSDPQQQQRLAQGGISGLQQGIRIAPEQEFGHTNLAWLLLNQNPAAAAQSFAQSARLVPAKRGVFYGLGLSWLAQGQIDRAVEAMTLEALRDPVLISSPIWKLPELQPLYRPMLDRLEAKYTQWLQQSSANPALSGYLHQARGGLRWWTGNRVAAHADLDQFGTPIAQLILALGDGKSADATVSQLPTSASSKTIAAWMQPDQRQAYLHQAWILATHTILPDDTLQSFVLSMNSSATFDQWLQQNAPSRQYRRERAGFGVLSRHIEGSIPVDFLTVIENTPIAVLFNNELLPSPVYLPAWDQLLQDDRDALLQQLNTKS